MKRVGNLMELIAAPENLRLAFWKAAKGKWSRPATRSFAEDFESRIARMSGELRAGSFVFGNYRRFRVFDPKERVIHAAAFAERVAHHGILNVCEPVFEKLAVYDSYACRKAKGRLRAIERAGVFARSHRWFLKMDVRKYFDSVLHDRLLGLLETRFKDRALLETFERIVRSYQTEPGRGLPIGSLTSQHFANFYLGRLDRRIMERERSPGYVRYMDDFVLWHPEREWLKGVRERITGFQRKDLGLGVKEFPLVNRTDLGMGFLGVRVYPDRVRMSHRGKTRFLRRLRALEAGYAVGTLGTGELQRRATCLLSVVRPWESFGFRHAAGIWKEEGGDPPARTVFCGVATGTTTRTTRGARSATTTPRPTPTTTTVFVWPERDLLREESRPEDAPVAVLPEAMEASAKSPSPVGVSRGQDCLSKAPAGALFSISEPKLPNF